jgi:hypothetical protein
MQTRAILGSAAGAVFVLATFGQGASAVLPDDLRVGAFVAVEGKPLDVKTVISTEVEVQTGMVAEDEVKGVISEVNAANRTLTIAGVKVVANPDVRIEDSNDLPTEFSKFEVGKRGKAQGRLEAGVLHASRIALKETKPGKENEVEFTGQISSVDRTGETFVVLGISVMVTPQTQVDFSK